MSVWSSERVTGILVAARGLRADWWVSGRYDSQRDGQPAFTASQPASVECMLASKPGKPATVAHRQPLTLFMLVRGTTVRLLTASADTVGTGPLEVSEVHARPWLPDRRSASMLVSGMIIRGADWAGLGQQNHASLIHPGGVHTQQHL